MLTRNDPPLARWGHFAWIDQTFDPDSMLIFGGRYGEDYDTQAPFSDVWRLNLKTLIWSKLNDGIPGKTIMVDNNGAVTSANGTIYFINTNRATPNTTVMTEIWKYEVHSNTFTTIPITSSFVPEQEWLFSVVDVKLNDESEYLVVYGGWNQNQFYRFNIHSGVFSNLTSLDRGPSASVGHEAISVRLVTGEQACMIWSANNEPQLWFYSYDNYSWSSMNISSTAPVPRVYTQIVPATEKTPISLLARVIWYVVGGHDQGSDRCLSDVWLLENFQ